MLEVVVIVKDKKNGERKITKSFNSGAALAAFYNSQPGHSIDREFDEYYRKNGMSKENSES